MLKVLLLIAVVLPCWYTYKRSVSHGLVEVNHVATLSFGFLFYWITPLAVRIFAPQAEFPLSETWSALFQADLIAPYAIACIALYACFALGDSLALARFHPAQAKDPKVPKSVLSFVTVAGCLLMMYTAFVFRKGLLRAATPTDIPAQAARGAVTAYVVLFGVVAILFAIDHPLVPWRKRLLSLYYLPLIVGCAMLLLLGSRLYVASLLVMFAIYQSCLVERFRVKTVVTWLLVFSFFFGAIGAWREHGSLKDAFFNVFEEPMLVSLSLAHHLAFKGVAWINVPTQIASDFMNLVPTLLVPNKIDRLKPPDAYSPLGGLHSFVSFNLNFGFLGSALFWFVWPMWFRYLKSRLSGTLCATMYILCSGWLTFTFFRDAFSISLIKAILEDSILVPLAIFALGYAVSRNSSPPQMQVPATQRRQLPPYAMQ